VDEAKSVTCPMAGFGISSDERSDYATTMLFQYLVSYTEPVHVTDSRKITCIS
jgi:hypothetical protein